MSTLLYAFILVFTFFFCAFAQTSKTLPCPKINLFGPASAPSPNEVISYSVSIETKEIDSKVEYIWAVSHGKIIEGQDTQNIKIELQPSDGGLTVTVEVKGLPISCPNTSSETMIIDPIPQAEKIDEFSGSISKIQNRKSEKLIKALQDDPTAQIYVFFSTGKNISPRATKKKSQEISKLLVRENGIEVERITIVEIPSNKELTQFWIVPAGSAPPEIRNF